MDSCGKEDDVALDDDPGLLFSFLHITNSDVSPGRYMAHIQTHGFAKEKVKGHLVNGKALGTHMVKCIHMGAGMFNHAQIIPGGSEGILGGSCVK